MSLPSAEHQPPSCGACGGDTDYDGDEYYCDDCDLGFDEQTLEASFRDPDAEVCGHPCDSKWHKDNAITVGQGFKCNSCQLPKGHDNGGGWFHWTDCERITLAGGVS